jgi:hypothetical protein
VSINAPSRRTGTTARPDPVPAIDDPALGSEDLPWARLAGVRLAIVLWGGLAVADVCDAAGVPSYAGLGALALVVAASSVGVRTGTALGVALVGWLLVDGFVVHRLGVLGFDGAPDTARLGLLVVLALAATRVRR